MGSTDGPCQRLCTGEQNQIFPETFKRVMERVACALDLSHYRQPGSTEWSALTYPTRLESLSLVANHRLNPPEAPRRPWRAQVGSRKHH